MILIPLSIFISISQYEKNIYLHNKISKEYLESCNEDINNSSIAKGIRPPSKYSFISKGMENFNPKIAVISKNGINYVKDNSNDSYFISMFGNIDIGFIIINIVSLAIIILSFDLISEERENGTLCLLMSFSVSKWKILLSKLISVNIIFLISLTLSFILSLIILTNSRLYEIFSSEFILKFIFMCIATIVYFNFLVCLAICISTLTRKSDISIIIVMLIWCCFSILIPRAGSMLTNVIYPIKTKDNIEAEIALIKKNYNDNLDKKEAEIGQKILNSRNANPMALFFIRNPENANLKEEIDKSVAALREEYNAKKNNEINKITLDYQHRVNVHNSFSVKLSLFSPACCYKIIMNEIAQTGFTEMYNFYEYSNNLKNIVENEVYSKWEYFRYSIEGFSTSGYSLKNGVDYKGIKMPIIQYKFKSLLELHKITLYSLLILFFYSILLFTISFFSFVKGKTVGK
jgi:ABC-type transport system involved in multi-copper enzyme maturation permease subunit